MDPIKYFYLRVIATHTTTFIPEIGTTEIKIELFYFEMLRMLTKEYAIEGMREIVNRFRFMRHNALVYNLMEIARELIDGDPAELHQDEPLLTLKMTVGNDVISKLVSEFDPDYAGIVSTTDEEDDDQVDAAAAAAANEDDKEEEEKKDDDDN